MSLSRVQQLVSKAKTAVEPLYNSVRSQVVNQYEATMKSNAQYVVQDKEVADKLLKQWFFTQMSKIPTGIVHAEQEAGVLRSRLGQFRDLPAAEMATYIGFAAELYAWFVIGEIIGRGGSLTGYSV